MTQEEAIRYACRIRNLVWRSLDPNAETACDCLCVDAPFAARNDFRDGGKTLDWILDAVITRLGNSADSASLKEVEMYRGRVKCDGNHAGPRCADPECWNDDPACGR